MWTFLSSFNFPSIVPQYIILHLSVFAVTLFHGQEFGQCSMKRAGFFFVLVYYYSAICFTDLWKQPFSSSVGLEMLKSNEILT